MIDGIHFFVGQVEVLELKNGDCYIKCNDKYYFKEKYYLSKKYESIRFEKLKWNLIDSVSLLLIIVSIVCLILLILLSKSFVYVVNESATNFILSILFLFFNVVIHECGHAFYLKLWNRRVGKIKINFRYLLPMVTVDTSDGYLLPKFRRCCLSYIGPMINIYVCFFVYLFFKEYVYLVFPVLTMITFCLIPIGGIRNDGYHILISTILNKNNYKKKRNFYDYFGVVAIYGFVIYSIFITLFK